MFNHHRRPRGIHSGRENRRVESFQVRAKEPLGTDSHRAISINSSGCRLLIGHKKGFVLLCPIGEQFLLSSFRGMCYQPSQRPRLITIAEALIIPDITKTESNNCFIVHCFEINNDKLGTV